MLKKILERSNDYNITFFVNDLVLASKKLGVLEAKLETYKFNSILIPLLQKKEAVSSMNIEGTQTTVTEACRKEITSDSQKDKIQIEITNHIKALAYGADYLKNEKFTHSFLKEIHKLMMNGIIDKELENTLGNYKLEDNVITNSAGTVVYDPPAAKETKKYMDELINYMNDNSDEINPLLKAAIIHSQFESIHPFSDGNGRVGRVLISLYLFKTGIITFPFFYMSEAINIDKVIYYRMLTDSRENSYDEWIKYFLNKIIIQTQRLTNYIDSLNQLYEKTKKAVKKCINSPKYDEIIECLFKRPVITADFLEDILSISHGQAVRYLNVLEKNLILISDDRKRGKTFYFMELLDLANGV